MRINDSSRKSCLKTFVTVTNGWNGNGNYLNEIFEGEN